MERIKEIVLDGHPKPLIDYLQEMLRTQLEMHNEIQNLLDRIRKHEEMIMQMATLV